MMKLDGLRVVDMSQFLPGPTVDPDGRPRRRVIKVEPPVDDPGRHIGLGEDGVSIFFRNLNRGKRSVCLDMKDPQQLAAMLELCDGADVFIESSRPGVAARLGLGVEILSARNPRLVYCSISAFGQTGPYRSRPAHDLAIEAMAGAVSCNLGSDNAPGIPHIPVADLSASVLALSAILMALYRRHSTGRGDFIDMSMHDAVLASFPNVLGTTFVQKKPPDCKTERSWGGAAFYQIYATLDGRHIALGGQEPKFIRNLLTAWGREDFIPLCERGPGRTSRCGHRAFQRRLQDQVPGGLGGVVQEPRCLLRAGEKSARGLRRSAHACPQHAAGRRTRRRTRGIAHQIRARAGQGDAARSTIGRTQS